MSRLLEGALFSVLALVTLMGSGSVQGASVTYTAGGDDPSDWADEGNWAGEDPTGNQAMIVGPFDVIAADDDLDSLEVGGEALVEIIGNTEIVTRGLGRPSTLGQGGLGTVEISDDARWTMDSSRITWVGDLPGGPGLLDVSGSGVFDGSPSPLQLGTQSDATLRISDDAQVLVRDISFGLDLQLPGKPNSLIEMSGGLLKADFLMAMDTVTTANVIMTGGIMDLGSLSWEAPAGCFRLSGGTLILAGDQTGLPDTAPWLKLSFAVEVSYDPDEDKTSFTVPNGSPPADPCADCIATPCDLSCPAPRCAECPERGDCINCALAPSVPPCPLSNGTYIGAAADPSDWGDVANWDTGESGLLPTGLTVIDSSTTDPFSPYNVNGISTPIQQLEVSGGSTLTLGGSAKLELVQGSTDIGAQSVGGILTRVVVQDRAAFISNSGPRIFIGAFYDQNILDSGLAPGELSVTDNGRLEANGFGVAIGIASHGTLVVDGNATVDIVAGLEFGASEDLGVFPDAVLTVNGGKVTAASLIVYQFVGTATVNMNGGVLDVGAIQFCTGDRVCPPEAQDGSGFPFKFNFSGGLLKINGDRRDILDAAWFQGVGDTQATLRGSQTWVTVGPPPVPECEDPTMPEYLGINGSDWTDPVNWGGCDPTDRDVTVSGAQAVDGATDSVTSFGLGGGATLLLAGQEVLTDTGINQPSFIGKFGGLGTLQIQDDAEYFYDTARSFWVGDPAPSGETAGQPNPGALDLSGNGSLRVLGPLQLTTCSSTSLSIADDAVVSSIDLYLGLKDFDPCPGVEEKTVTIDMTGGRLVTIGADGLSAGAATTLTTINMSGGEMDLSGFTWNATEGSFFNFDGGIIKIDGDHTDIVDQPWFNGAPDTQANFEQARTLITVGAPPGPTCETPDVPEYTGGGMDPSSWTDIENWGLCDPTNTDVLIGTRGSFTVDATTVSVTSLALGGGSVLELDETELFSVVPGDVGGASFLGEFGGSGTLRVAGEAEFLYDTARNFWVGDPAPTEGHPNPGIIELGGSGKLRMFGPLQLTSCSDSTLTLSDNSFIDCRQLYLGLPDVNPCPGASKSAVLTVNGGRLLVSGGGATADGFVASSNLDLVTVTLNGGEMDLANFEWNAPPGSTFNFNGGTIIITGDHRDIPGQPWFVGQASASFDGSRTTILVGEPVTVFRRGDCDQSGKLDFNDAIFHLRFLFLGENETKVQTCRDACDSDDSGTDDFTDDINSLQFLFLGQGNIPAPGPMPDESHSCGSDPTDEDEATCVSYTPAVECP